MRILLSLLIVVLLSISGRSQELKTIRINGSECVNGHIIVKFKQSNTNSPDQDLSGKRQDLLTKYKANVKKQWKMKAELWQIDTLQMTQATKTILDSLKKLPYVQYAEPDFIVKADATPNDPYYDQQWALHNTGQNGGTPGADIHAPEAWDITTGDTNIVVGVIDTGIDYLHPDLAQNIWTNWDEIPGNGIDDDNNGYIDDVHGWDFCNNDNDPMDDYMHGTHVSGIIGAVSNNGTGIAGVAWKVRLMPLKFLDHNGNGYTSNEISAIEYSTENGAKLTNNSWGGGMYSQALYDAIAAADSMGILFIVSAGNNASDNDNTPYYPSCIGLDNIISVASTNSKDSLSFFSNWGLSSVDIAAPGSSIFSTKPNNTYGELSGTSMAAPHVAGAAVLAWATFPGFTHHQIKQQLLGSADQLETLTEGVSSGGRLNTFRTVNDTCLTIEVLPRKLNFGAGIIAQQSEPKIVIIANISNKTMVLDSIISQPGFLISTASSFVIKIYNLSIPANHTDTLFAMFRPDSSINYIRSLFVYSKIHGIGKRTLVKLTGYGFSHGTIIPAGEVSGIWDNIGSPYLINGDITVATNSSLIIKPKVQVLFNGHFGIKVNQNSTFRSVGTITDSIVFSAIDTTVGWNGIRFWKSSIDDTLKYCIIKYINQPVYYDWFGNQMISYPVSAAMSIPFISNNLFTRNSTLLGVANWGVISYSNAPDYNEGGNQVIVSNNKIIDNNAAGISFNDVYGGIISGNLISNNFIGLDIQMCSGIRIKNNIIVNNIGGCSAGGGVFFGRANISLINNVFARNSESPNPTIFCFSESIGLDSLFVLNNIFWGNNGVPFGNCIPNLVQYSDVQGGFSGVGNLNSDPLFINPTTVWGGSQKGYLADWHLLPNSPCKNTGFQYTRLNSDSTRSDMGAFGALGPYPQNEYIYIEGKLQDTLSQGNYLVYNDLVIKKGHTLFIKPGASLSFFNSRFVVDSAKLIASGTETQKIVFKTFSRSNWGGLKFYNALDTSALSHIQLSGSVTGGIFNYGSKVKIYNSNISNNSSNRSWIASGASVIGENNLSAPGFLLLDNCLIDNNHSIFPQNSGNQSNGPLLSDGSKLEISNSIISNNSSASNNFQGGLCFFNSKGKISNCLICNNSEFSTLFDYNSATINSIDFTSLYIENTTISNNYTANNNHQIVSKFNSRVFVNNSIIRTISSSGSLFGGDSLPVVRHSNLNSSYPGPGNICANPLFVNPTQGDGSLFNGLAACWQIQSASPCIDAGINDSVFSGKDLAGNARIWDGNNDGIARVDMGAYEYGAPLWLPGISGHFYYNNSAVTPLDSVSIVLRSASIKVDSTCSNNSGFYQFLQRGTGTYTVNGSLAKPWKSVNGTDALKVQRHFAGLEILTEPIRLQAADVNASGSINATDAVKIKRRFAGLDNSFAAGDWTFAKPIVGGSTVVVQDDNVVQNFYGLCVGDVNGSWGPGSGTKSAQTVSAGFKDVITAHAGQHIELPVTVDQAIDLSALSLVLKLPEDKIRIKDVKIISGTPTFNQLKDELRMAWSEVTPLELKPGDTVFTILAQVNNTLIKDELIYPEITFESELANKQGDIIIGSTVNINPVQIKAGHSDKDQPSNDGYTLQVIPNPNSGQFILKLNDSYSGTGEIKINDAKGSELLETKSVSFNNGSASVSYPNLKSGSYLIRLKHSNTELKGKLIIR